MNRLIKSVQLWAKEKGLVDANPQAQYSYVNDFPRHVISRCGKVVRLGYKDARGYQRKPIIISQRTNPDGYLTIRLQHEGKSRYVSTHRLLAEHFIPNPDKKETVNHIDGNKTNNNLDNLEWSTRSEQMYHAYELGLKKQTPAMSIMAKMANGKPVKCLNKRTGKTTYHLTAKDCSLEIGFSSGWCDKMITSLNGDIEDYKLEYVTTEELKGNLDKVSFETLIGLTSIWAIEKGLHNSDPQKQMLKALEELGEVSQEYTRGDEESILMETGDVLVTLVVLSLQLGINPEEALKVAYDKIKDRKGKLVNGTFIKQEDLKELEK